MSGLVVEGIEAVALPQYETEWLKGRPYLFRGYTIVIEHLAGDTRTKIKKDNVQVSGIMPAAYGRILGTTDRHSEELDFYLSPLADENVDVLVIDQVCAETGLFDEHKVMFGFSTVDDAVSTYLEVFSDGLGTKRLGAITSFPGNSLWEWFSTKGNMRQPAMKCKTPGVTTKIGCNVALPMSRNFSAPQVDEGGGVIVELPDLSQGPKLITTSKEGGGLNFTMNLFSAIETEVWSNAFDLACRTLDLASEHDTFHIRIASPGGSVFLMGRLVSAIKRTHAKVVTYAQGPVASAATTIWASGHERHILPGAYFMQHMSSQFMSGKTTEIQAKTQFCMQYISKHLQPLVTIGLFTPEEVDDMITKHADVFISGRQAIERVGEVSGSLAAST